MKKRACLIAALAALLVLPRLPHPARDVSRLLPVQTVYLYIEEGLLRIETDTGDSGSGADLTEAAESLRSNASGEIFLDTAEFLILHPDVPVTEEFYAHLRPGCRIVYTTERPDLAEATQYLAVHKPAKTLADIRGGNGFE